MAVRASSHLPIKSYNLFGNVPFFLSHFHISQFFLSSLGCLWKWTLLLLISLAIGSQLYILQSVFSKGISNSSITLVMGTEINIRTDTNMGMDANMEFSASPGCVPDSYAQTKTFEPLLLSNHHCHYFHSCPCFFYYANCVFIASKHISRAKWFVLAVGRVLVFSFLLWCILFIFVLSLKLLIEVQNQQDICFLSCS